MDLNAVRSRDGGEIVAISKGNKGFQFIFKSDLVVIENAEDSQCSWVSMAEERRIDALGAWW